MMRCGVWEKSIFISFGDPRALWPGARPNDRPCFGPSRKADLHAQSKGSYLRQSERDGPRSLDITGPSQILIMGGRCGMRVEGRRGSQTRTPRVPLQLLLRDTHSSVRTCSYMRAHTRQRTYTTLSPRCARTHRIQARFYTLILSRNWNSVDACSLRPKRDTLPFFRHQSHAHAISVSVFHESQSFYKKDRC